jgi:hypothetical protein
MPTSFEHIVIYGIVLLVLIYLGRRLFCSMRRSGKCSDNCTCGKGEIRRDPVITDFINKGRKS